MKKKIKKEKLEVTYTKSFAGVIRPDPQAPHLRRLEIRSPRWYQNELNKFKEGEEVTLEVHNRKPKRTIVQNRYYWGPFMDAIVEETGEQDRDRLHELFSGMFLTEGVVEVLGKKVRMKKSTTELSTFRFSDYIMKISAETGVEPPPTENYNLESLEEGLKKVGENSK